MAATIPPFQVISAFVAMKFITYFHFLVCGIECGISAELNTALLRQDAVQIQKIACSSFDIIS